jgi:putative two-component system response regulator
MTERIYRPALSREEARTIVSNGRGTKFDPDIVDAFESIPDKLAEVEADIKDTP